MRVQGVRTGRLARIACAALLCAPGALAGELWIQPEPPDPAAGQEITLRLFEGEPFAGEERPYTAERNGRFLRLWKKGRTGLTGLEGRKPAARFVAEEPGAQLIVLDAPSSGSYCKALVVVGAPGAGDPLRWSELGQRLELVPQSDPVELLAGASVLEVQVLFEREPLAGVRVAAVPASAPREGARSAVTDEIGLVTLTLDRPGWWLVRVAHRPRGGESRTAGGRELTATLMLAAGER
jgi:hypothetical protein